ncbi:MAG: TlpA family protein disulfide reductase [Saprospiraceae bacterium]
MHNKPSNVFKQRSSLTLLLLCFSVSVGLAQQYFYKSKARPKTEIDTLFPYDIQLTASGLGEDTAATTSTTIFGENLGKRPTVMLFWLTTCAPCRLELDAITKKMEAWEAQADFAFVPISLDFERRRDQFHARAAAYPWRSYLDENREFPSVMPGGLNGVPQLFVFDAEGKQVFYRRKYRAGDLEALEALLIELSPK